MQSKLDVLKADVIAKAVATGTHGHDKVVDPVKLKTFLEQYYRHVAAEDVAERQPNDCLGAARHHYKSAMTRPQGTAKVHVFTPTLEENGWSAAGRTVVEIVVDKDVVEGRRDPVRVYADKAKEAAGDAA